MTRIAALLLGLATLVPGAAGAPAAAPVPVPKPRVLPAHEMYVCLIKAQGYVVGSKLVDESGLFRRGPDGSFRHTGINYPGLFNAAFDPRDPSTYYVASINGCLVTHDGGRTWRIGTGWDVTEPKDLRVDPGFPDRVYAGLPDGVVVSEDRGFTWTRRERGLPERGKYTQAIEVDRTRAGRVLAGCESGIYLSEDAARSWRRVFKSAATVDDIEQSPGDPRVWIAVTQADGGQLSRDGGLTWTRIAGLPSAQALYNVAFDPTNPRRIAVSSWTYGILTSEDGGATWTDRTKGLPAGETVFRTGVDPDTGRLYASVYDVALYFSDNFGRSWKRGGLAGSRIYNFIFFPRTAAKPAAPTQ